jgi:acyl-coenzyme A thioesterase PaaI-like protein
MMQLPEGFTPTDLIDPFEVHLGPIYERPERTGRRFLLIADERHVNGRGVVHGGMLMTFADLAFGQAA